MVGIGRAFAYYAWAAPSQLVQELNVGNVLVILVVNMVYGKMSVRCQVSSPG